MAAKARTGTEVLADDVASRLVQRISRIQPAGGIEWHTADFPAAGDRYSPEVFSGDLSASVVFVGKWWLNNAWHWGIAVEDHVGVEVVRATTTDAKSDIAQLYDAVVLAVPAIAQRRLGPILDDINGPGRDVE